LRRAKREPGRLSPLAHELEQLRARNADRHPIHVTGLDPWSSLEELDLLEPNARPSAPGVETKAGAPCSARSSNGWPGACVESRSALGRRSSKRCFAE
jgi:hypothetical protein